VCTFAAKICDDVHHSRGIQKYYLVVQLVKMHSISALVERMLQTRFISSAEIRRQSEQFLIISSCFNVVVVGTMSEDDDIITGSLKMSLKCPVCLFVILHTIQRLPHCNYVVHSAQLHAYQHTVPFSEVHPLAVLRRDVVVFCDAADDDMVRGREHAISRIY
jgi:Zn finger protein HypA/HybF involved in hydrogenase expression